MSYSGQYPPYGPPPSSSGKATASLVLGICGFLVCPLVCSVLAIVFANQAYAEIDASGGRIGGRGLAQAGLILGWIGVGLCVVGVLFVVVIFLVAAAGTSDLSAIHVMLEP